MSIQNQRTAAVTASLAAIREIEQRQGVTRASLEAITAELQKLAAQPELFSFSDFPPPQPESGSTSTRYYLNHEGAETDKYDIALYLNSIIPGKTTVPHNHTTWAVIVAVTGQELNRVYQRVDDGSNPEQADLKLVRELTVQPGTPISFLADDIHSIHVQGDQPTLHFHLYGRPLDTLTGRIGIDPETGRIVNYNQTFFNKAEKAA
ncbi:putative metal-dependent enzyme (double-stranded beta helix superfamily) [Herbaspirillum sp. Sphag1AN]|uniref:cysteine dioxygenase family protein n=1 Tax=unclassified Herbaspirillum TaxID=2624150 RepID=UPI00160F6EDD|nr:MULTISPECIES: cysteine dioxygenase family protein [unclassified Herbaspirillum]MBB3213207.1 putative metal-dependent enzyme (double-stranded beta helix superfamily) [Herbaspirillum sp. Sphag1AN]MBB3246404.1 putative metal-dependent enzyme (double-stranded beta helix superfamily) [Herbaspirillum sp. Sphag64]